MRAREILNEVMARIRIRYVLLCLYLVWVGWEFLHTESLSSLLLHLCFVWIYWKFPNEDSLRRARRLLTRCFIRSNLSNLGLKDMSVTGTLCLRKEERTESGIRFHTGREVGRATLTLSHFCGLGPFGLAERFEADQASVFWKIFIEDHGKAIGFIDEKGCFHYETAPDLRTALGWMVATDGGRESVLWSFDLDQATATLYEKVRQGTNKESFIIWSAYVVDLFMRTRSKMDGYLLPTKMLWRVVTRELGEEHSGYDHAV